MDNEQSEDTGNLFPIQIYEVIRIIKGVPLFIEDHIDRLYQSARLANIDFLPGPIIINDNLIEFIKKQNLLYGNIKISFYFESASGEPMQSTETIPHLYPSDEQYKSGINVSSMQAERTLPNAKIQHTDIRERANKIIADTGIWDVILLDKHGFITEGSKTNIFFIKEGTVVTTPPEKVLQGTTRKKIIKLCIENNIPISEEPVHYTNLFHTHNIITQQISALYDKEIEQYFLSKESD
jgi:branched-chain amino acid aminotransferase